MKTDKVIIRVIAFALVGYGAVLVLTAAWQALNGYEIDGIVKDLLYLLMGGFLTKLTGQHNNSEDGLQQIEVPAPLIPDTALTPPVQPPAPIQADSPLHPDTVTVPADL